MGGSQGFPRLDLGIGDYARLGVVVFFFISGYLITTLLENEWGTVALGRFYIRRALRLLPAAYVYLICVFSLAPIGFINLTARDFWHSVAYIVNYLPNCSREIGHLWSLSVEEQFYLLWPLAILRLGPKKASWIAWAVVASGPVARLANRYLLIETPTVSPSAAYWLRERTDSSGKIGMPFSCVQCLLYVF